MWQYNYQYNNIKDTMECYKTNIVSYLLRIWWYKKKPRNGIVHSNVIPVPGYLHYCGSYDHYWVGPVVHALPLSHPNCCHDDYVGQWYSKD